MWGTSWIASKIGVQHAPGLEVAAIRQCIAGVLLIGFYLIKGERFPDRKQMAWLALMGVLLFVSANGVATLALKSITSGMGALISALYPLSVVVIERVFFRAARITKLTLLGLVLGIGGIGIVFYDNAFSNHSDGYTWGVVLSVLAMLSWALGTIVLVRTELKMNSNHATGWQMLISSLVLVAMLGCSGTAVPLTAIPLQVWGAIAYLVVASNLITFAAFVYSMKHLKPAVAALYAYINPIVATVIGAIMLHESITPRIIAGSAITLVGVFIVSAGKGK